ncbi:MAG: hypothetical protein H7A38_01755 [Chlamydiales bacterium]|nr:hypothetical protein [Chlamydiales bacterium]
MTISALCSNFSNYAFQGITAAAPALISVALRPQFCGAQPTKTRTWTYFALGTFLPTLGLLHWHGYARKTSVMGALVFTGVAAYISRPAPTRTSRRAKAKDPSNQNPYFLPFRNGPKFELNSSHYFQIDQPSNLPDSLKPENWAGKKNLDCNKLATFLRFREYGEKQRKQLVMKIYTHLVEFVSEQPIPLPFVFDGEAHPLIVKKNQDRHLIFTISDKVLTITPNGESNPEDMDLLDLIYAKHWQIQDYLKANQSLSRGVFEACSSLLERFAKVSALEESNIPYQFGPLWNPLVTTPNHYFEWIVTKDAESRISLEFVTRAHKKGQPKIDPSITLQKTQDSLKVVVSSQSIHSEYTLKDDGKTVKIFQNEVEQRLLSENATIQFLLQALYALADLQSSPQTVVVDLDLSYLQEDHSDAGSENLAAGRAIENARLRTLEGDEIPGNRLQKICCFHPKTLRPYIDFDSKESTINVGFTCFFGIQLEDPLK